jgi:hypothetical protein
MGSVDYCAPCPKGSYSGLGEKECHACFPGQYFDPKLLACVDCAPSYYSTSPRLACMKCPRGKYSGAAASSCLVCPGERVNESQTGCDLFNPVEIPPPSVTPTSRPSVAPSSIPFVDPTSLPSRSSSRPTTERAVNPSSCPTVSPTVFSLCLPGQYDDRFYSPDPSRECKECPYRRYAPDAGMTKCKWCGRGYNEDNPNSRDSGSSTTRCNPCPANSFEISVINISRGFNGDSEDSDEYSYKFCEKCPEGEYVFDFPERPSTYRCRPCFKGYREKADKTNCEIDPDYNSLSSTSRPTVNPTTRPSGPSTFPSSRPSGPSSSPTSVTPTSGPTVSPSLCLPGQYDDRTLNKCVSCLPGFYSPDPSRECKECPDMRYAPDAGMTKCKWCGIIFTDREFENDTSKSPEHDDFITPSKTRCDRCPPNTYSQYTSPKGDDENTGWTTCYKCSKGEYDFKYPGRPKGGQPCIPCPKGYRENADKTSCETDPDYISLSPTSSPSAT